LSRSVLDPVKQLFRAPRPTWSCEFTAHHVIVAGVDGSRKRVAGSAAASLPPGALVGSLSDKNLTDSTAVLEITRSALKEAGARGFELSVVIPDDSSRVAFLTAESLVGKAGDRDAFIRWKLKKSVPFDVDSAQLAYQVLGPSQGDAKGVDLVVALSPRSIVQEYEELVEKLGYHAGYIVPSTIAAMNLLPARHGVASEDELFVKITPESITTTVFQHSRPRFYRRVGRMAVYDAVYPTVMYYQDKLGGVRFSNAIVCGYNQDPHEEIEELQEKMGVPVKRMEPRTIDDIYKPALGAVDLIWANLI